MYYQIAKRRGKKKAALAVGHKILTASYHILKDRTPYTEPRMREEILVQRRKSEMERLQKRLDKLKILASN